MEWDKYTADLDTGGTPNSNSTKKLNLKLNRTESTLIM